VFGENDVAGPIQGVKILDLTGVVMGPYATRILADLGAEVIKVESPQVDSMRTIKPSHHDFMAGTVMNLHANKKSIVLDLKAPEARHICLDLAARSDVFIHSMRPAAIKRLGLAYADVAAGKPDIIYCSAIGFGRNGPYANKAAYDDVIQAASGIPWLFARARGTPDYVPAALCDKVAGLTIVYSVLAALVARGLGRGGQEIEVPMFETAAAFNVIEHLTGFAFEPPLEEIGWSRILASNRRPFPTKDGHACILPYSKQNWDDFFRFIGREDFCDDPRFATHPGRIANTEFLYGLIAQNSPRFTKAEWMAFCDEHSIPCMPAANLGELWDDPHLKAVGLLGFADHPTEGRYRTVGLPTTFMGTPAEFRSHAPAPGQHTVELLQDLGLTDSRIEELISAGAVQSGHAP
jgi:crotonobetainyl-CoA:carnitine CoA-transferase CaiB-like acyl-CoA transferase